MERRRSGFGNDKESFTPVRRKLSTIDTRQLHKDEKEWTAPRCNRLLRALKSRVAILNRDISSIQSHGQVRESATAAKVGTARKATHDEDWSQARKKVKRTYSTRGGRGNESHCVLKGIRNKDNKNFIPGEVLIPTPILNRVRGDSTSLVPLAGQLHQVDGEGVRPNKHTKSKDEHLDLQLSETLRDIRKHTPASRYTIYGGIYNGLEALLKATVSEEADLKRGGPKSLLSICLDKVPHYIAQEDKLSVAHMEETGSKSAIEGQDVSIEIYDELEAFGSNGTGWKHLRSIVRAHGIQIISEAIRARSLDDEFVGILVTLCIHTRATKEAQVLLSSLLLTTRLPEPKSIFSRLCDEPATRSLSMLWKFVEITGSFSFQYRQLSSLLCDGLLPLSWLASKEFGSVWTKIFQAISHDSTDVDALMFLDVALPLLARVGEPSEDSDRIMAKDSVMIEATKHTFSSLLTALLSIVILSSDSAAQNSVQGTGLHIVAHEHLNTLIRSCLMEWELYHAMNVQGILLTIANIVLDGLNRKVSEGNIEPDNILLSQLRQLTKSSDFLALYSEIVSFICSISRCCGRGASNSGFGHLENLHEILEGYICGRESDGSAVLREIIADSALAFSQQVPDQKHLEYATAMEGRVYRIETKPKANLVPGTSPISSEVGFRWEEGICEWVMATPSVSTSKSKQLKYPSTLELSEHGTPFRSSFRRIAESQTPLLVRARPRQFAGTVHASAAGNEPITSCPISKSISAESDLEISTSDNEQVGDEDSHRDTASHNPSEDGWAYDTNDAGDEPPYKYPEAEPPDDSEDVRSEYQSSSGQDAISIGSTESPSSSPRSDYSECSLVEKSFTSVCSLAVAQERRERGHGQRYIDRVPRLNRRVLRRSQQWQLFEESDDELSFTSVSTEGGSILKDVTNSIRPRPQRRPQLKIATKQRKALGGLGATVDSEDELRI